jgi:hypothetical protein
LIDWIDQQLVALSYKKNQLFRALTYKKILNIRFLCCITNIWYFKFCFVTYTSLIMSFGLQFLFVFVFCCCLTFSVFNDMLNSIIYFCIALRLLRKSKALLINEVFKSICRQNYFIYSLSIQLFINTYKNLYKPQIFSYL